MSKGEGDRLDSDQEDILKKAEVEKAGKEVYEWMTPQASWESELKTVKAFYRKIARWHLSKLQRKGESHEDPERSGRVLRRA